MDSLWKHLRLLDQELSKFPALLVVDQKLGIPMGKTYAVAGFLSLYLLLIVFNFAGSLLTNLLGFVYPAYASFHAIESHAKDDDTQWLTYWTVFAFFNTIEFFSDILLYWLPFYFLLKACAIVYLAAPQTKGAVLLYQRILRPILLQHAQSINGGLNKAKKQVAQALQEDKQA